MSTCHEVYVNKMYSEYNGCTLISLSLKYVHAHQNFTCGAARMVIWGEGGSAQTCFCSVETQENGCMHKILPGSGCTSS